MNFATTLRPWLAASVLCLACAAAQAATVNYTGLVDSGSLAGTTFSGSFSYAEPVLGFDGPLDLDTFTLDFNGNTHTLVTADAAPIAWFVGGSFIGIDYVDQDSFGTTVALMAGFFDISQALFSYQVNGADQGLGGFTSFTQVPEPSSMALLLAGLGFLGASRRRA